MRGYLSIVPVALRGSTTLYVRRDSGDRVDSSLSGSRVQGTGRGTHRPDKWPVIRAEQTGYDLACRIVHASMGSGKTVS